MPTLSYECVIAWMQVCGSSERQRPSKSCACYEWEPTAKWIIIAANNLLKMNTKNKWMKKMRGNISEIFKKTNALWQRSEWERASEKESQRGIMTKHVQLLFGPFVLHFMLDLDYTLRFQHVIEWTSTATTSKAHTARTQINALSLAQRTNACRHARCACFESNHHKRRICSTIFQMSYRHFNLAGCVICSYMY